ncbi:MAG: HutD family protein, partial [Actinobacteria bacterium]|nr:HutD family protein [Actinomycetota bacterium]
MSSTLIDYARVTPTPWKNGRGVTRILCDDSGAGLGTDASSEWSWRISIAEITGTQPYSPYPGVHRSQVALG